MNSILIVLPILTILMYDLGLTLDLNDFRLLARHPRAVIVGMTGQLILLPLIAWVLGYVFNLEPVYFIGLMLIACSPEEAPRTSSPNLQEATWPYRFR